jgi:PDZ domain
VQHIISPNIIESHTSRFFDSNTARAIAALLIAGASLISTPLTPFAKTPTTNSSGVTTTSDTTARTIPYRAVEIPCENVEGVILVPARIYGAERDTSGQLVIDTGAGFLGLGYDVVRRLGLDDRDFDPHAIEYTKKPVRRLDVGSLPIDYDTQVITLDHEVIRRVTDRDALGVIGQRPFSGRKLWIDYAEDRVVIIPPTRQTRFFFPEEPTVFEVLDSRRSFGNLLTAKAASIPFKLAGDGKMLVRARFRNDVSGGSTKKRDVKGETWSPWLTMIFDTGATKSVLFEPAIRDSIPEMNRWRSVAGLIAPTLVGSANARIVLAPVVEVGGWWTEADSLHRALEESTPASERNYPKSIRAENVDCASIETSLSGVLTRAVGEPVFGLIGYSLLRHFRVGVDYQNNVVWLDPYEREWDDRANEYCHVGVQLERDADVVRVVAVADGSPAAQAGIARGDELVRIDGQATRGRDLNELARRLEGAPGSRVTLVVRHGSAQRSRTLTRRCLL